MYQKKGHRSLTATIYRNPLRAEESTGEKIRYVPRFRMSDGEDGCHQATKLLRSTRNREAAERTGIGNPDEGELTSPLSYSCNTSGATFKPDSATQYSESVLSIQKRSARPVLAFRLVQTRDEEVYEGDGN